MTATSAPPTPRRPRQQIGDRVFSGSAKGAGILILVVLAGVAAFLVIESLPAFRAPAEDLPGGELNWPPDYPKQPGEPPRVQPSKKVAEHWDADGNRVQE